MIEFITEELNTAGRLLMTTPAEQTEMMTIRL